MQAYSKTINEMTRRLVEGLGAGQAWLFGSRARGDGDEESDVDMLLVISHSDQPRYKRNQAARKLVMDIAIPKDIIVMTQDEWNAEVSIPSSLCHTVKNEGRLIYG